MRQYLLLVTLLLLAALAVGGCEAPGATNPAERVHVDRVVLLSTEAHLSANLSAKQLAAFIRDAQMQISQSIAPNAPALHLVVQFTLQPRAGHIVQITTHDGADTTLIARLTEALRSTPPLYTQREPVLFQVQFSAG